MTPPPGPQALSWPKVVQREQWMLELEQPRERGARLGATQGSLRRRLSASR
mgnify:CR=1 FL=1